MKGWNEVDRKTAIAEFNKWLDVIDFEGIRYSDKDEELPKEDKNYKLLAGRIIKTIISGQVSFAENYEVIFKLKSPIMDKKDNVLHTEISLKIELLNHEYNSAVNGLKSDDGDGRMLASICAFANMAKHKIDHLPYKEVAKLQAIVSFLL